MTLFSSRASQRALSATLGAMLLASAPSLVLAQQGISGRGIGIVTPPIGPIAPLQPPAAIGSVYTTLQIVDTAGVAQTNVPVTFGQVFAKGAFPASSGLAATYNGVALAVQVDIKATHADGSVRHAVISTVLPQLNAGQSLPLVLSAAAAAPQTPVLTPGQVLGGSNDVTVNLNVGGQLYTASAYPLFKVGRYTTWLTGAQANEWQTSTPLVNAAGMPHPHLSARFAARHYRGGKVRFDVTIENNWAYEPDPKNVVYDAEVLVGGQRAYSQSALTHFHHARWRKLFWAGAEPKLHVKHDTAYLIATQALPNYDQTFPITPAALGAMKTAWDAADIGPMGMAMLTRGMGTTGGRPDIGLHHAWAASYVLSQDARAKEVTVGLSNLGGSWPIHYRDRLTDQPVSIVNYPYVRTIRVSSDSYNPTTKKYEDLPQCTAPGMCAVPYQPDNAHQPSLAYIPYLVTGDAYHLDELLFWANWNIISLNPGYRNHEKGIVARDQVRGQAWSMRTLGYAAYITPDKHPLKGYFSQLVDNNLDFYNTTFVTGNTNPLGFIDNTATGYAVGYTGPDGEKTGVAPWQDDFFTSSVGHLLELGFTKAKPILQWKARFPIGRMTAPGFCWIDGAAYTLYVRPGPTAPYYPTFADVYKASMRTTTGGVMVNSTGKRYLDQACGSQAQADWRTQIDKDTKTSRMPWVAGEMTGYATATTGYPANMQPALAMAANAGVVNGKEAWARFAARNLKPNYGTGPQFAIVPR